MTALASSCALGLALLPHSAQASACGDSYVVQPGDSLWSISRACGVSMADLTRLNHIGVYLQPGQVLRLVDPTTEQSYVVQPGDTLSALALRLGISPSALAAANGLSNPDLLQVGQVLHWSSATSGGSASPAAAPAADGAGAGLSTYVVQPGDTLSSIALAYNVSVEALESANSLANPNLLSAGSVLRIPGTAAAMATGQPTFNMTPVAASYTVVPGDTLSSIEQSLGLAPGTLAQTNGLDPAALLQPGQVLRYTALVYTGPSRATIGAVIDQQAALVGLDDALLRAVAWRESSWRMVDGPDGGIGVMQLMPATVQWLQATYVPGAWDPHDLTANVHAAAVLLAVYSRLYGGDVAKIATAYHGGMGAVGRAPSPEMQRYIDAVEAFRQAFASGAFPS